MGITRLARSKLVDDAAKLLKVQNTNLAYAIALTIAVTAGMPHVRIVTFFVTTLLIPAYLSSNALDKDNSYDAEKWFSYWILYGFWMIFDKGVGRLFSLLPVYWFFRILILMFLYLSDEYGSAYLFRKFLEPTFIVLMKFAGKYVELFEEMTEMQSIIHRKQ